MKLYTIYYIIYYVSLINTHQYFFMPYSVPWLEATASDFLQPREAPSWTIDKINNSRRDIPRYFKTHATVDHLPRGHANIKGK